MAGDKVKRCTIKLVGLLCGLGITVYYERIINDKLNTNG